MARTKILTEVNPAKPKLKKFIIKLKGAPSFTLDARNEAEAWESYKAHFGIIDTIHTPAITEADEQS